LYEKEKISKKYVYMIEWVYEYYMGEVKDMRCNYGYNYAPLLKELIKIKKRNICQKENEAISEEDQLKYVLPKEKEKKEMKHAYCRYIWEAHPLLEEIEI
jgi:5'-3' exonuclease